MSDVTFTSAYGSKTLTMRDAYSGTFLDVTIESSHRIHESNPSLSFRMNTTDEKVLLAQLLDRANKRAAREAMLADWDEALAMNERYDRIHSNINMLARKYDELAMILRRDFDQDTRDWKLNV